MRVDFLSSEYSVRQDAPHALGRYHLLRLLAHGGMSEVYHGYDTERAEPVAIKILLEELACDRVQLYRFKRETLLALKLFDPHIVRGLDHGVDEETGRPFLVLEYIDGPSAQCLFDRIGRFDVSDVVHIGMSIARALNHLHRQKYIHRDIKPDNILLSPYGEAKLTDFGLVKWYARDAGKLTMACDGFGTSYYMPYEQCLNAHLVDARSDIFALGATLYHLVTGRVPFVGEDHHEIMRMKEAGHFTPPGLLNPKVPPSLQAVLVRMLAASPTQRYQTASDVYIALKRTNLATEFPKFVATGQAFRAAGEPVRQPVAPTQPDLRLRASALRKSRALHLWFVRYRDGKGRLRVSKGTTEQIFRALRTGKLLGDVEASRQRESPFRPLAEFPEFHSYFGDSDSNKPPPISRPHLSRHQQRCWYRRMLISLGFALFILGLPGVCSVFFSIFPHV